jgi:hypothetical protein
MKPHITGLFIASLCLAAPASPASAQEAQPSQNTILVGSDNVLRCRLEKGLRITKAGEPITARLVEPVYVGKVLAIPEGASVRGHVSSVSTAPSQRTSRLLKGDFTPPRVANVTFDQLVLADGTSLPIHTDSTVGVGGVQSALYLPRSQRPGIGQMLKDAAKPLRGPNKLQRLKETAITSLPYHPEYLDQGTIFDATLLDPITPPMPVQPLDFHRVSGDNYLHLRLLTPVTSEMTARGTSIMAVVSQPYYNSDGVLIFPAGTMLAGTVGKATPARRMKKNGVLLFSFRSAQTPDGATSDVSATVAGIQAGAGQRLTVGEEGDIKATNSLFTRLRALLSLVGPSRSVTDSTVNKTAWSRAVEGRNGFGLIGAGAAQASAATATGFGYFGGAMKMYNAFLAKGSNVELPVNTPILLRIDEKPPALKSGHSQTAAVLIDPREP